MGQSITFYSPVNHSGQTTLIQGLAHALADRGRKILLFDANPQMGLTALIHGLAAEADYSSENNAAWLKEIQKYLTITEYLNGCLRNHKLQKPLFQLKLGAGQIDLISGDLGLFHVEADLIKIFKSGPSPDAQFAARFQYAISEPLKAYDLMLIDTATDAGSLLNALFLTAGDYLVTPVSSTFFSLRGLSLMPEIFKTWLALLRPFKATPQVKGLEFKFQFLGYVLGLAERFYAGGGSGEDRAKDWFAQFNLEAEKFYNYLAHSGHAVDKPKFHAIFPDSFPFVISSGGDFISKINLLSEKEGLPFLKLSRENCEVLDEGLSFQNNLGSYVKSMDKLIKSYFYMAHSLCRLVDSQKA